MLLSTSHRHSLSTFLSPSSDFSWKILIFDKHSQSILASLFTVSQLHKSNITLHLFVFGFMVEHTGIDKEMNCMNGIGKKMKKK